MSSLDVLSLQVTHTTNWVRKCTGLVVINGAVIGVEASLSHFHEITISNFIANCVLRLERVGVTSSLPVLFGDISVVNIIEGSLAMESSVSSVGAFDISDIHKILYGLG